MTLWWHLIEEEKKFPPGRARLLTNPVRTGSLELTRFRGHPMVWGERTVHDAQEPSAVPPEFRQRIIDLVRKGRTPEELARQFEPSAQAIRNWMRQADRDDGRRQDGLTTVEQDELRRLRRSSKPRSHPVWNYECGGYGIKIRPLQAG
jgi:transposase